MLSIFAAVPSRGNLPTCAVTRRTRNGANLHSLRDVLVEEVLDMGAKWLLTASLLLAGVPAAGQSVDTRVELGPRPQFLVDDMRDGPLKTRLQACLGGAAAAHGVLDRPSRCRLGVSGAHARSLRGRFSHGRGHARVRRHVHQGSGARLPALAERSRDDDGHLAHAARAAPASNRSRPPSSNDERRRRAARESRVPHERAHARRVQVAARQDRCVRSGRADRRAVRDAATAPHARISARASSAARCSRMPRASRCFSASACK